MKTSPKAHSPIAAKVIQVWGLPAPQGSKRHVGHGIMIESSKKVKPWREAVKTAALTVQDDQPPLDGPIDVTVHFYLPRPKGHYGTGRNTGKLKHSAPSHPATRPDVDKLVRSTLDALGDAYMFTDDSQVVNLVAGKRYATNERPPGATIKLGQTWVPMKEDT